MTTIRQSLLSTSHKIMLGAQVVATTLQPLQAAEPGAPHEGDDRFDQQRPKTEVVGAGVNGFAAFNESAVVDDGKSISWLDAVAGTTVTDSTAVDTDRALRAELNALANVRVVVANDTLTIHGVPEHLRQNPSQLAVVGSYASGGVTVAEEGRRELKHSGTRPPVIFSIDTARLAATGALRVTLPESADDKAMPDVVTLTVRRANGDAWTIPLSTSMTTRSDGRIDVPDPLAARLAKQPKTPAFSVDSLRVTDVQQGAVGSCYFLASMAALLVRDQGLASRAVAVDDHRLWVKFQQPYAPTKSTWVLSDLDANQGAQSRRLPTSAGAKDSLDVMWPVVMEKAWMTMSRGHDYRLENGGAPDDALRALGVETIMYSPESQTDSTVLARILAGDVYVAATHQQFAPTRKAILDELGLVPRHAYTVLGADADARTVDLYNPWGSKLTVSIEAFREAFSTYYEKRPPLPAHIAAAQAARDAADP